MQMLISPLVHSAELHSASTYLHPNVDKCCSRWKKTLVLRIQVLTIYALPSGSQPAGMRPCQGEWSESEQEKAVYTQKVDFGQLKTELQLMERNDLATLKAENDRLMADLEKLKQRLREEITRTQAGVRLDLNLEKGRLREESGVQEIKIREVETRIETEIAALRTAIQTSKATTLQYLVTFVTGCSALLMAYMRFRF